MDDNLENKKIFPKNLSKLLQRSGAGKSQLLPTPPKTLRELTAGAPLKILVRMTPTVGRTCSIRPKLTNLPAKDLVKLQKRL